jgi:hypothetical protein
MKAANVRSIAALEGEEKDKEVLGEATVQIKALDSEFTSFGDALFSWTNSTGFEAINGKCADSVMVKAFCVALGIPSVIINSDLLDSTHYFESDAWLFDFIEAKGFIRHGHGRFFLLDEHFRPIARLEAERNTGMNFAFSMSGAEPLVKEFREIMKSNIKFDAAAVKKTTYAEVVKSDGMMGMGGGLRCITGKIENPRVAKPEYYPYLDGGIEALLRDFVESDECVLILKGPPGTGKSSLVAAGIDALHLLPIYAKRADAILDKNFINFIFQASDGYMNEIAGTAAKARSDLFIETLLKEREFAHSLPLFEKKEDKEEPRVPIIVVEDGDSLLTPRSQGNIMMPELLNETDGIGSNHTRKLVITTNVAHIRDIDEALMRPGRCYGVIECRLLTPDEAIAARAANGLPEFEVLPVKDMSLAEALRKPRKRIQISNGKAGLGFNQ